MGPDIVRNTAEAVEKIKKCMLAAQDRHKFYADPKCRPLEFFVGDKVFLKVAPMKGIIRFGKKGKLSPRFIGPLRSLKELGMLLTNLLYPQNYQVCIRFSMFLC